MLKSLLSNDLRNIDLGLLVLRLLGGGMMLTHGYGKFMKVLKGDFSFGNPIGLGPELSLILTSFAEFICAIALIIGFKTRLASLPLMFAMFVAFAFVHINDPFRKQEFPLLYFTIFLAIFLMGAGKYSIDGQLNK